MKDIGYLLVMRESWVGIMDTMDSWLGISPDNSILTKKNSNPWRQGNSEIFKLEAYTTFPKQNLFRKLRNSRRTLEGYEQTRSLFPPTRPPAVSIQPASFPNYQPWRVKANTCFLWDIWSQPTTLFHYTLAGKRYPPFSTSITILRLQKLEHYLSRNA